MNHFLLHLPEKKPDGGTNNQPLFPNFEPLHNRNERLDSPGDTIRLNYQPLMYTEGCIAAGCPENLW